MSAVKFNNDKEVAIEFHQLARDFGSKYPEQIKDIYLQKMQTTEGKEFVNDYIKHKSATIKLSTEKAVLTKGLTKIEENKPYWKNHYPNKSDARPYVEAKVKDDVAAMVRKEPHPQLTEPGYQFKHFSADISVQNSINKEKSVGLEKNLKNLMSNLLEKGMKKEDIKLMTEQGPEQKIEKSPNIGQKKGVEIAQ